MTRRQLVFVAVSLLAAYSTSLQIAAAQSPEHPTTLQWNAAKLCEKALQKKYPPSRASVDSGKRVVLNIDHAQLSDLSGDPCFRIALHNWTANGDVSIQLIGPKGEIVPVVPTERPIHASPEGGGTVTIPYKHRGLYPGLWLLMASGPCGIHECKVEIPKVLPLDGNRKEERLVFKTRNTLSSSLPYHFGVYEPPAANAVSPMPAVTPPSIDKMAGVLEQKEAELNRRAIELDAKAAELKREAAAVSSIAPDVSASPTTPTSSKPTSLDEVSATAQPSGKIATVEEAKQFVLGTWTYTGQQLKDLGDTYWEKWVIKPDGTLDEYRAAAKGDDWGTPSLSTYEVVTGKFSDTGRRYFGITVHGLRYVITDDGALLVTVPSSTLVHTDGFVLRYERGDKNPFSR